MRSLTRKVQRIPLDPLRRLTLDPMTLLILHLLLLTRHLHALSAAGVELRVRISMPYRIKRPFRLRALFAAGGQLRVCILIPCGFNGPYGLIAIMRG